MLSIYCAMLWCLASDSTSYRDGCSTVVNCIKYQRIQRPFIQLEYSVIWLGIMSAIIWINWSSKSIAGLRGWSLSMGDTLSVWSLSAKVWILQSWLTTIEIYEPGYKCCRIPSKLFGFPLMAEIPFLDQIIVGQSKNWNVLEFSICWRKFEWTATS